MSIMSYTRLASLLLLGLLACGTTDRRIDPDQPDEVGGAVLDSQDIRAMASKMSRDLVADGVLRPDTQGRRTSFYVTRLRNDSSEPIDTEMILTMIRTEIFAAMGRQVQILDRSKESAEEVLNERAAKRSGAVTKKDEKGLAGADYVLKGTIKERLKQSDKLRSVYYLVTFDLVDLESQELSWTKNYEVKFESEKSVITR